MHLDLCTGEVCAELAPSHVGYVKGAIRCGMFKAEVVHASLTGTAVKHSRITNVIRAKHPGGYSALQHQFVLWCLHMIMDMLQRPVQLLAARRSSAAASKRNPA